MAVWNPPRNKTGTNINPYTAINGDVVNCLATGGIPSQPYKRIYGIGGGTYNDFQLNTTSLPSHYVIFELPPDKPIYPSAMMLTSWTENDGFTDRAFGALPTRFKLWASNDGQNWVEIFNQSETLTIEYLVDNKFSPINDGVDDPVKDYILYANDADTTGIPLEDVYFKPFSEPPVAYSRFKLTFDSNSPEYRIDKQYNSTTAPPYIGTTIMRISNFAVYGGESPAPNPQADAEAVKDQVHNLYNTNITPLFTTFFSGLTENNDRKAGIDNLFNTVNDITDYDTAVSTEAQVQQDKTILTLFKESIEPMVVIIDDNHSQMTTLRTDNIDILTTYGFLTSVDDIILSTNRDLITSEITLLNEFITKTETIITILAQKIIDLAIPFLNPILPTNLQYDTITITPQGGKINILAIQNWENEYLQPDSLAVDSIRQTPIEETNSPVEGTRPAKMKLDISSISTETAVGIVADSYDNYPENYWLWGVNSKRLRYVRRSTADNNKFNFYTHSADGSVGRSLGGLTIGECQGIQARFSTIDLYTGLPRPEIGLFYFIYTFAKGDGTDMGSWYNSRLVISNSVSNETIDSDRIYTLDEADNISTRISSSYSDSDIIMVAGIGSNSTEPEINWIFELDAISVISGFITEVPYVVKFTQQHNILNCYEMLFHLQKLIDGTTIDVAITNSQDPSFFYGATGLEADGIHKFKFNKLGYLPNPTTTTVLGDEKIDDLDLLGRLELSDIKTTLFTLPIIEGITVSIIPIGSIVKENFLNSSHKTLWGEFSAEETQKYIIGIHSEKTRSLSTFKKLVDTDEVVKEFDLFVAQEGFTPITIMWIKQGLYFGMTVKEAYEFSLDRRSGKPLHPKIQEATGMTTISLSSPSIAEFL